MDGSTSGHRLRLRERFLAGSAAAMTEASLLELLLTFAIPQKDVQPLARTLLHRFGSLRAVMSAPPSSLAQVPGIGEATLVLVKLVAEIADMKSEILARPAEGADGKGQMSLFSAEDGSDPGDGIGQDQEWEDDSDIGKPDATDTDEGDSGTSPTGRSPSKPRRVIRRSRTDLFGQGLLKDAIEVLPKLPDTESLDDIRQFLRQGGLHYNSEQTRERYAAYIVRRLFPLGHADRALRLFAQRFEGTQAPRDAAFYRFMKAEPLVERFLLEVILPALGRGQIARGDIRRYLIERFPDSRGQTIISCAKAMVGVLASAGIVRADRETLFFQLREIPLEAFAFLLHSEFPEPGMYDLGKVEANQSLRTMLWRPDLMLPSLYELRNRGLIAKVSQIDSVRQFTTRYDLEQLVVAMVEAGAGSGEWSAGSSVREELEDGAVEGH